MKYAAAYGSKKVFLFTTAKMTFHLRYNTKMSYNQGHKFSVHKKNMYHQRIKNSKEQKC